MIVIMSNLLLTELKHSFYFAVQTSSFTYPVAQSASPEFLEKMLAGKCGQWPRKYVQSCLERNFRNFNK